MYERFRKEKIEEARSKGYETRWEWECDGHDGYYCDADILLWHFKIVHGTLGILDAIVTFQDATNLERTHDNLFLDFLHLEHAQVTHEHTEQPATQLGSISFIDAKKHLW